MFCSKGVLLQKLHCKCHTLPLLTTFTQDELYKMYSILQLIAGGNDIFSAFIMRLQPINIMPTRY